MAEKSLSGGRAFRCRGLYGAGGYPDIGLPASVKSCGVLSQKSVLLFNQYLNPKPIPIAMNEVKHISDEQLMQEIKAGNMLAFDALYRKYSARIYKFAVSLLKVPEEAENIVQDVFLNLWINRDKVDKGSSVRYYVFTIAYHASITAIRKKLKESNYIGELVRQLDLEQDPGSLQLEYRELEDKLNTVIDELPARQKEVYLLHRVEGLKYAEIAERLGLSVNTIENHMARALHAIRAKMGGYSLLAMLFWALFA